MQCRRILTLGLAIVAGSLGPAGAAFRDHTDHAFAMTVPAAGSARAAFRTAVRELPIRDFKVTSALADRHDHIVEGFFTASNLGRHVVGILFARADGQIGGIYDVPATFSKNERGLLHRMSKIMRPDPEGAAAGDDRHAGAIEPLQRVSFGSGTVGLPPTWRVLDSYQGCVEAASSADNGYFAFGCGQFVRTPYGLPGGNPLVLPYGDPPHVFVGFAQTPRPKGLSLSNVRLLEVNRIASLTGGAGQAAYLLYEGVGPGGAAVKGLQLFNVAPTDQNSFNIYSSGFMLPAAKFARLAPTLWHSWRSWTVNQSVFDARLAAAAESMRETGALISGSSSSSSSGSAKGFDQYIRDTATVQNSATGARLEGTAAQASAIVESDPTKYEIVPGSQL